MPYTPEKKAVASRAPSLVARPNLTGVLSGAGPVALLSAPAGSGKTMLLRSWIETEGLRERLAWVTVEREEQDAQRFWLSVIRELRLAIDPDAFVERLEPTPTFDGEVVVGRLLSELGSLDQQVLLVVDDLHELRSSEAQRQLELLLSHRPEQLRVVIATRHDPRLGLHRLRLLGQLTEIRGGDLRFTRKETEQLLAGAGVDLPDESVAQLHERTEGWAAGLRLAALALAGRPDPERFVAEFSGSERTVADYLFAEVLERQPAEARRLLLRTSILDRVDHELADVLTGSKGSQAMLQELERQNAFVLSIDSGRTLFRYHRLFADLLRLELERTEPEVVDDLHLTAARWYEANGHVVAAIGHAQAAKEWQLAAELLVDRSFGLWLDGRAAQIYGLLARFPADVVSTDAELARLFAGGAVWRGSLSDAKAYLALAERNSSKVPTERRHRFMFALGQTRLMLAGRQGDSVSALAEMQAVLRDWAPTAGEIVRGDDVRAAGLLHLGVAELGMSQSEEAERHLEQGLELARIGERPYLEAQCLAHLALAVGRRSLNGARTHALEAVAIAEAHGWGMDRALGGALAALGMVDVWQGRFDDAERWVERAARVVRADVEPSTGLVLHVARGRLSAARGQPEDAADAFRSAAELEGLLVRPHMLTAPARRLQAQMQARLGDLAGARATLAELRERDGDNDMTATTLAYIQLVEGDPKATADSLAPVLSGSLPSLPLLLVEAFIIEATARRLLGQSRAAEDALERALDLAEPEGIIWPFVVLQSGELLEHYPPHRSAHGALLKDVLDVLGGSQPSSSIVDHRPYEALSEGELRVLRFLPSNLGAADIARELYLSFHTVKTHMRHIYAKLGVHRRTEAVERARQLGLIGPSSRLR